MEFHDERSGHKIYLIPSSDGRDKPAPLQPKMGRRESERVVGDTSTYEFTATRSTFWPPPWIPSPWGRAPMKPWRKGAKGRRFPMMPEAGESPVPPPTQTSAPLAAHLRYLHCYLHHQLLLFYSGSSSHTPLYRPM
jgi:hypothetical protein